MISDGQDWSLITALVTLLISKNRLPAISGIAEEYSTALGDEYLAGLWRKQLIWTLGWRRKILSGVETIKPFQHLRQERIGSPSWSWKTAPFPIKMPSLSMPYDIPITEIVNCQVNLSSPDLPFGDVLKGRLTLQLKHLPLIDVGHWKKEGWFWDERRFILDYPTQVMGDSIYSSPLAKYHNSYPDEASDKDEAPESAQGLVVRKRTDGNFERIGYFEDYYVSRWESLGAFTEHIVILE